MSPGRTVRVAAIQPRLELGAVEANLSRAEDLVRDAHREHQPEVILLPEAATSPNVYSRLMRDVPRPIDGQPFQLISRLARELDCVVGGGFLSLRGSHAYGSYVLAEPDGSGNLHDKDIPTVWENNYYRGGSDDGVVDSTSLGRVGIACGWEWARNRTARRLRAGGVQLLTGGMCWPSFPGNWRGPLGRMMERERGVQRQLARELPRQVARMIGAPVAMPSHVGDVSFDSPLMPGVPWRTSLIGETQIVERDGTILARLSYEDGEGHISAEINLAPPEPLDPIPDRFWIPVMPAAIHAVWHPLNLHGAFKYRAMRLAGKHPWQPYAGGDLPNRIEPSSAAEAPSATSSGAQR
ncbi:MAG: carbon-nitrogen hydrolase family protein [Solirubrobacterales bacterium]